MTSEVSLKRRSCIPWDAKINGRVVHSAVWHFLETERNSVNAHPQGLRTNIDIPLCNLLGQDFHYRSYDTKVIVARNPKELNIGVRVLSIHG